MRNPWQGKQDHTAGETSPMNKEGELLITDYFSCL